MQPRPFAGQQVSLDDLSQQGVAQLVAVLARPGHQQLVGDRGAQCLHQGLVFQAGDLGQEPVGDPPASHRHHCKDLPCQLGQRLDPATQQIPQRRWQLTGAGPDGPKQLLGEQRVALRTSEHRVDQVGGRRRPRIPTSWATVSARSSLGNSMRWARPLRSRTARKGPSQSAPGSSLR